MEALTQQRSGFQPKGPDPTQVNKYTIKISRLWTFLNFIPIKYIQPAWGGEAIINTHGILTVKIDCIKYF